MRALDCNCGQHLEAATDEELFRAVRAHIDQAHPELQLTDQEIRDLMVVKGYNTQEAQKA
jgi:predicted small metal-binding protein